MAAGLSTEELIKRFDEQHKAYLDSFKLLLEALLHNVAANSPGLPVETPKRRRRSTVDNEAERPERRERKAPSVPGTSVLTGDSDESDVDDELYVQTPLPSYKFDTEHLRHHLKHHKFNEAGKTILKTVVRNGSLLNPINIFPTEYPPNETSHNSHYSVFDVGTDGAPLSRSDVVKPGTDSIDSAIWQVIQVGWFRLVQSQLLISW